MCVIEFIKIFSGPIGILLTAIVAIYSIRRTAREARISNIHSQLMSCLADTIYIIGKVLNLLNDIGYHKVYRSIPDEKIIETAYDRYWREIGELSQKFREIQTKQRLLFPKPLYDRVQEILKYINEGRKLARNAKPKDNYIYPDTSDLLKIVDTASKAYRDMINESRKYLGTDLFKPVSTIGDLYLEQGEEAEENGKET